MQVGMWVHNPENDDADLAALGQDGVLLISAHHQYVSGLRWLRDSTASPRLITASYDGSVLLHDVAAGHTRVVSYDREDDLSALGCLDSSTVLTGDSLVRACCALYMNSLQSAAKALVPAHCPSLRSLCVHRVLLKCTCVPTQIR